MKIVVWNCRMALARKRQPLYGLQPDIAVIPECSKSDLELCLHDGFDGRWFGDNPRKGLGVLVRKPLRIARTEKPLNRWIAHLSISGGPCPFRLIAVWAMPIQGSTVKSYIGQVYEAAVHHSQWFASRPAILCGDLNSNKFWDGNRKTGNHSAVVSLLEKRRLLSAYHHFFSEAQGQETRPTYYFWHHKDRGYHIDYVFLPRDWAPCIKTVEVGDHSAWSKLSDHVPLSVDLTLAMADPKTR
jgi:exonuclease III